MTESDRLAQKRYMEKYPDRILAAQKRYRDKNREKINARSREKRALDPQKARDAVAKYRANNADALREKDRLAKAKMRKNNPEYIREINARYRERNREKIRLAAAEYRRLNPEQVKLTRKLQDKKNRKNPIHRMRVALRSSCRRACIYSGNRKSKRTLEIIGADVATTRAHIESLFKPGMSFDNYGEWEIDHIIPLASAKTIDEAYKLCHYKNLQPLWREENRKKADSIITNEQQANS